VKASKSKFHEADLPGLFEGATRILVGRGKSYVTFTPGVDGMDSVAEKVLGRSGTLRAPAARVGSAWLVGFTEDMWSEVLA
jgi:hypothetical protein